MKKGQTKRVWTPEQKAEIVHKYLDEHISVRTLEKQYNADVIEAINGWIKELLYILCYQLLLFAVLSFLEYFPF